MPKKLKNGEIYTPDNLVKYILDGGEYQANNQILGKHVIDNSCGNGQILVEVAERYAKAYFDIHGSYIGLDNDFYKYIHGIEIKEDACDECRKRIALVALKYGILVHSTKLDIVCGDAFKCGIQYVGKMDYVFGNPPYIRYRDLSDSERNTLSAYPMCGKGLADVYIAFFELGIQMLHDDYSTLSYITPSSWINSTSGVLFRQFVRNHDMLRTLFDFEHEQVFEGVTTYSMITVLQGKSRSVFDYYKFNSETREFEMVDRLRYNDAFIGNKLYLGTMDDLDFVRKVLTDINTKKCYVKNGLVTLADKIFIDNLPEEADNMYTIKVIKSSNGKESRCLFPYDVVDGSSCDFTLTTLERLNEYNSKLYEYVIENEAGLRARTYQPHEKDSWYGVGRSQGMKDIYKFKYAVPSIVKDEKDIKFFIADKGVGVYGGMYAVGGIDIINKKLVTDKEKFFKFIKCLKHYKSGGYYTFTSVELEKYLNYED